MTENLTKEQIKRHHIKQQYKNEAFNKILKVSQLSYCDIEMCDDENLKEMRDVMTQNIVEEYYEKIKKLNK